MTSVSTLFREARRAKDPKKAALLRAKAAKMRKDATKRKRKSHRKAKGNGAGKQYDKLRFGAEPVEVYTEHQIEPGELSDARLASILTIARKNPYEAGALIRQSVATAAQDARQALQDKHGDALRTQRELNHINQICAFIAEMEGICSLNNGALPPTVMVSGMSLARIIAQLREDGFDTEGRKGVDRAALRKAL